MSESNRGRADFGLADLYLLLHGESGLSPADACSLAGYELPDPEENTDSHQQAESGPRRNNPELISDSASEQQSADKLTPYYLCISQLVHKPEAATTKQTPIAALPEDKPTHQGIKQAKQQLPHVELFTAPALKEKAAKLVGVPVSQSEDELKSWLHALSRAEIPKPSKQSEEQAESGEIWLVQDYDYSLMPWWPDIRAARNLLLRYFGKSRSLSVILRDGDPYDLSTKAPLPWPGRQTSILVFSDLALYAGGYRQQHWLRKLQTWQEAGAQISVFLPHSKPRHACDWLASDQLISWDHNSSNNAENPTTNIHDQLLACVSLVQWCSPALLRCWRRLLNGSIEDEFTVWWDHRLWQQPDGCGFNGGLKDIETYRELFLEEFESGLQEKLLSAISEHRSFLTQEVRIEEHLIRSSMGLPEDDKDSEAAETRLSELDLFSRLLPEHRYWLQKLSDRQCERFWEAHPQMKSLCLQARRENANGLKEQVSAAPGLQPFDEESPGSSQPLSIIQRGQKLYFHQAKNLSLATEPGITLLNLSAKDSVLFTSVRQNGVQGKAWYWYPGEEGIPAPAQAGISLHLENRDRSFELVSLGKPIWADSIEQNAKGLFCTLPDGRQLRWYYPGELVDTDNHIDAIKFSPLLTSPETEKSAWVCEHEVKQQTLSNHHIALGEKSPVITPSDIDDYGHYRDVSIGSHTLRLRWIPPGEFLMGSPDNEPERRDNEQQHLVVITQGYWLAEAACTQSLWQDIMGENPSQFKGEDLPVETVSWDEVQRFIKKLNQQWPNMHFRLPTEAEWEYACRARSEMSFWWGSELSTERANYDGSRPYNQGAKGENRGKTVSVKSFDPNPWGLYQMHGNVYEWCQDWYTQYPEGMAVDPQGAQAGESRVLRGGSWFSYGEWLRSAYRGNYQPVDRYDFTGFRLAAGPRPGGATETGADAAPVAKGSGSGRRNRGSNRGGEV